MAAQPAFASGLLKCPRDARGLVLPIDALERFREKCRFDAITGCVLWIGGTTRGRGNSAVYGSFWDGGRRWYAHRWAAKHIHGVEIDGLQVGHCCPNTPDGHPNTLCVEHVIGQTQLENLVEQMARGTGVCAQPPEVRKHWLLTERGYEEAPPVHDPLSIGPDDIPFFTPPAWLGDAGVVSRGTDCPF